MSEAIRKHIKKRKKNNNRLTDKTKQIAIQKLDHMKFFIGKKKGFIEDPDVDFTNNDCYTNYLLYMKWEESKMVEMLNKAYNVNIWNRFESGNIFTVNAYYNPLNNEMTLPCGILQKPFVDISQGIEYTLGFLGVTIAHELTHSLDDDGCKYDYKGNYINWWSKKDMENYKKKQMILMRIYGKIVEDDGFKDINQKLSLGENIADVGGLDICEDLLVEYYKNRKYTKSKIYDSLKKFFKFYSFEWRDKMTHKFKHTTMKTDEHLFSKYRCNGTLANSKMFKEVYDIGKGDGMYIQNNVKIW